MFHFITDVAGGMNTTATQYAVTLENTAAKEPRFWVIPPFLGLILITCIANISVVLVTTIDSKLKGITYMYVTSLAVADFMVSIF